MLKSMEKEWRPKGYDKELNPVNRISGQEGRRVDGRTSEQQLLRLNDKTKKPYLRDRFCLTEKILDNQQIHKKMDYKEFMGFAPKDCQPTVLTEEGTIDEPMAKDLGKKVEEMTEEEKKEA